MATEKKQSFLGGAAVLAFGIVAVKIIGAVFKIPLRNILGEGGSADFSNAYNIYATLLTVSTAGLPVALSKLVSESYALGRTRQAHRTFRVESARPSTSESTAVMRLSHVTMRARLRLFMPRTL